MFELFAKKEVIIVESVGRMDAKGVEKSTTLYYIIRIIIMLRKIIN